MNSNGAAPKIVYDNTRIKVKFNGNLLKQDNVIYNHGPIANVYIVYRIIHATITTDIVLKNCLLGAVKVTNASNPDPDKWQYSPVVSTQPVLLHTQMVIIVEMLLSLEPILVILNIQPIKHNLL